MASHVGLWIGAVFCVITGFVVGGLFWPLYRATRWKLRRMAEGQEFLFRNEAIEMNSVYSRRITKKYVRP